MNEIGSLLKATRESSGISVSEVSADLNILDVMIENIEDGKIGAFKDIYVLKDAVLNYAKYLGLDEHDINNKFNEYLFEYTSKIPVKEIEKAVLEQTKELKLENENKVISPYTMKPSKHSKWFYVLIYVGIIILVIMVIFWSIKQIVINNHSTNVISYVR